MPNPANITEQTLENILSILDAHNNTFEIMADRLNRLDDLVVSQQLLIDELKSRITQLEFYNESLGTTL